MAGHLGLPQQANNVLEVVWEDQDSVVDVTGTHEEGALQSNPHSQRSSLWPSRMCVDVDCDG